MNTKNVSIAILFASILLMISVFPLPTLAEKGPRSDDLIVYYYGDVESAYAALKANQIDAVGYEITADLYVDASADANIVLGAVADMGFYEHDVNNNATIDTYPGVRSPTNYTGFRQAMAWLTDKEWVVDEACGGFAERNDQMIASPFRAWGNETMMFPFYPYEYDPIAAADALDGEGFLQGTTPNPYHDAAFPGSAEYIRVYPAGHSKAGQDLDNLEVCVRTDDTRRLQAGRLTYGNMRKHGIPVNALEADMGGLYDKVMGAFDYHMYTGGWSVGRFPPVTLHGLYHSEFTYSYGPNYVTGNGTHPYLDTLLDGCRYPATYDEAISYTKLAAGYMTEICVNIPLFSAKSFWPWRKSLVGVVNMAGSGPENGYTFVNAYKVDDSAIRYGPKGAPTAMNIFYSSWYYDWQNLERMNMYGGVDVPPYDLSADQDGLVTERLVGTWWDTAASPGDENKTKVTYTFRTDAYFVEPVTGNQLENVDATNAYVSIWYDFQLGDGWFFVDVTDIHHLNIIGSHTIELYFNSYSYWNAYYATPPFKSFNLLQKGSLSNISRAWSGSWTGPAGFLGLSHKVYWVVDISVGGVSLTRGSEWHIQRKGPLGHADVWVNTTRTGTLVINYWSAEDGKGFTPGNLPWTDSFEGAGAWYATAFTSGIGGSLSLKKSAFFYMEKPLLGEIDWVKKSDGAYKVDIYDIVFAAGAYGSQGTGIPSSNWFAGADVAPEGGKVDIYDIVTIASRYGQSFDVPP
ncbi:MAG: ABC transporter substrate-binding protein [Candidatus Bathyarchaeota archaeon]|nr:ABC transporter substrate-binding protein [Candidatus Bathyarchaeota archaeon]